MSSVIQKNEQDSSEKMDIQNSQNIIIQHNDSNKFNPNNNKNNSACRKTSKRREAQQEKATVLQLFKQLLKVVNQKFENAYLSPPKPKMPKPPKIVKTQSVKTIKKQENLKNKKQEPNSLNFLNGAKNEDRSQSKQLNPLSFPSKQVNTQQIQPNSQTSPNPFQSLSSNSHLGAHVRKSSQSHTHRQKSLNEKHQLLKQTLKKQIFQNYSVQMRYIVHEEIQEEPQEIKPIEQNNKMIDQSSEVHGLNKNYQLQKNYNSVQHYDDLEFMSNQEKIQEEFIKSMNNINNQFQEKQIIEEIQKEFENQDSEQAESQSSSSCEQNQKYPPHSHMPEGHASTTEQFLQQHHPIITTLPHSCQSLAAIEQHHLQSQQIKENHSQSKLDESQQQKEKQEQA